MAETVGTRMRQLRGDASQDLFASELGVHKETVGKYERDKILPGADVLIRLREGRGVDINWLLTGAEAVEMAATNDEQQNGCINTDALAGAIAAVEELMAQRKVSLPYDKKAKLVALVYGQLTKANADSQIERGLINDLIDLAS